MAEEVMNVVSRRESFGTTLRAGKTPLTDDDLKLARSLLDPKHLRTELQKKSDMRNLIDTVRNMKEFEDLSEGVAVRVAVGLLVIQTSDIGRSLYRQFQLQLRSMNIPPEDLQDLHIHLDLFNPRFVSSLPWTALNRPGVLNIFAHLAGLQSRVTMAARYLDSSSSELAVGMELSAWLADLQNNYLEAGMENHVIQLEGIRARLARSNHSFAAKASNMISIWEATNRNGAPEDVVAFVMSQLSADMAA